MHIITRLARILYLTGLSMAISLMAVRYAPPLYQDVLYKAYPHTTLYLTGLVTEGNMAILIGQLQRTPYYAHVDVVVNTPGGSVDVLNRILTIIDIKRLRIHAIVEPRGLAGSCGSVFLLHAVTVQLDNSSIVAFHTGAIPAIINGKKVNVVLLPTDPNLMHRAFATSSLADLTGALSNCMMTQAQFTAMEKGATIWLTGKQIKASMVKCHH